ncbi:hypothetical protein [Methylobacterium nodulans]|uniref:Uncharacterized protein n=1 Tax=Methylobacterium nodulans (strain LMG 21967 / CNCM I-2342 / ORS 2060) TaxID=460265 RepID=B8ISE5_METNO|nr:hypothetical protein [Methylobacterium nodulans]ACL58785.1 hypothetical protein Mnod_3885 [Methylobacterium nodulans ORS 2060]
MAFNAQFNANGDPLKIWNHGGGAPGDPLDPALIFSAQYPPAVAEEFILGSPADMTQQWRPRVETARKYYTFPWICGTYINNDGTIIPMGALVITNTQGVAQSLWICQYTLTPIGDGRFAIDWSVQGGGTSGTGTITAGTLKFWVLGRGD